MVIRLQMGFVGRHGSAIILIQGCLFYCWHVHKKKHHLGLEYGVLTSSFEGDDKINSYPDSLAAPLKRKDAPYFCFHRSLFFSFLNMSVLIKITITYSKLLQPNLVSKIT